MGDSRNRHAGFRQHDLHRLGRKLVLDQPATFTGAVTSLGTQNSVDFLNVAFGAQTTLAYAEKRSPAAR
jgi:hypothetical protein